MKNFLLIASLASSTLFALSLCVAQEKKEAEWVSIFDGKTMKGWHVSSKTGHSRPSKIKLAANGRLLMEPSLEAKIFQVMAALLSPMKNIVTLKFLSK